MQVWYVNIGFDLYVMKSVCFELTVAIFSNLRGIPLYIKPYNYLIKVNTGFNSINFWVNDVHRWISIAQIN